MALKFVRRKNIVKAKRKIIVEHYEAIDQFGELPERKRDAEKAAFKHGHDLAGWHERPNDPAGRWNNFCLACNQAVVVCTEAPEGFPQIYGPAYTKECAAIEQALEE
jgi:hypothetical protein